MRLCNATQHLNKHQHYTLRSASSSSLLYTRMLLAMHFSYMSSICVLCMLELHVFVSSSYLRAFSLLLLLRFSLSVCSRSSLKTCIEFYAACDDCTFLFRSIKCLCKALTWDRIRACLRMCGRICKACKRKHSILATRRVYIRICCMRSLALVTLSSYVVCLRFGYDGMKLRIELVSRETKRKEKNTYAKKQ